MCRGSGKGRAPHSAGTRAPACRHEPRGISLTSINLGLTSISLDLTSIDLGLTSIKLGLTSIKLGLTSINLGLTSINLVLTSINLGLTSINLVKVRGYSGAGPSRTPEGPLEIWSNAVRNLVKGRPSRAPCMRQR